MVWLDATLTYHSPPNHKAGRWKPSATLNKANSWLSKCGVLRYALVRYCPVEDLQCWEIQVEVDPVVYEAIKGIFKSTGLPVTYKGSGSGWQMVIEDDIAISEPKNLERKEGGEWVST